MSTRRREAGPTLWTQLGSALAGLWRLLFGTRRVPVDQVKLLAQFAESEQLAEQGGAGASQAVLKADTLLDSVMKAVGGRGESFADRLRSLERQFDRTLYQQIWTAHKLRNEIAHEHPNITSTQAHQAIAVFRRAASRLGAF